MIGSKLLWRAQASSPLGNYFGGLDIINTHEHRAGAGEEVFCRWGAKGTLCTHPRTAVPRLESKGADTELPIINHRGVIFISHK